MEMKNASDFINHLRHVIQENESIELSEKSMHDLENTFFGYARACTKGSLDNMKEWRSKYYNLLEELQLFQQEVAASIEPLSDITCHACKNTFMPDKGQLFCDVNCYLTWKKEHR
jgi:hypothetical protein